MIRTSTVEISIQVSSPLLIVGGLALIEPAAGAGVGWSAGAGAGWAARAGAGWSAAGGAAASGAAVAGAVAAGGAAAGCWAVDEASVVTMNTAAIATRPARSPAPQAESRPSRLILFVIFLPLRLTRNRRKKQAHQPQRARNPPLPMRP